MKLDLVDEMMNELIKLNSLSGNGYVEQELGAS